ncbi:MAG TPA: flavodoxin family protein [Armatimonadota bacterium]|nr:flavodoxin family protein [Armatimonadota bacterium]
MKVVAFNGSARKHGNTTRLIETVFEELNAAGIDTELIEMAGTHPYGCSACNQCRTRKDGCCANSKDQVNAWIAKMKDADGIILASPTYYADVTSEMKALIDRAGYVAGANDAMFKRKVGAAVIAVRRGGEIHAFDTINHFFTISQMIIPGSSYWNFGFGRDKGDVEHDDEGLRTMRTLGQNMAWLLQKLG